MWNLQQTKVALGQVSLPELLLSPLSTTLQIIHTNPHLKTYSKKDKRAKQYTFGNMVTLDRPVLAVTSKFWSSEGSNAVKFHTEGGPTRCMFLYLINYANNIRRHNTILCTPVSSCDLTGQISHQASYHPGVSRQGHTRAWLWRKVAADSNLYKHRHNNPHFPLKTELSPKQGSTVQPNSAPHRCH